MEEDLKRVETLTAEQAGKIIGKNAEYIRALLRQGRVEWGTAVQSKSGQWNYNIIKSKFLKYADTDNKKQDELLNLIYLELVEINKKLTLNEKNK
jgi:hypothetical protein